MAAVSQAQRLVLIPSYASVSISSPFSSFPTDWGSKEDERGQENS